MTKAHTHNIGLAIWRLKFFYETFVQGPTAVILLNFCAKNRHIAKPQTVSGQAGRQSRPKTGKPKTDQSRQTKNKKRQLCQQHFKEQ